MCTSVFLNYFSTSTACSLIPVSLVTLPGARGHLLLCLLSGPAAGALTWSPPESSTHTGVHGVRAQSEPLCPWVWRIWVQCWTHLSLPSPTHPPCSVLAHLSPPPRGLSMSQQFELLFLPPPFLPATPEAGSLKSFSFELFFCLPSAAWSSHQYLSPTSCRSWSLGLAVAQM